MQRVLQIIGGMNRAGAETMLMNIYRVVDRKKLQFDFVVYSDEKQDYEDEIVNLGGRVIHLPCKKGIAMIGSISKIRNIIKKHGPYCAIHSHTLHNCVYSMIAAKRFRSMTRISHSHTTVNSINKGMMKKIYEQISKYIIRCYSDKWLACGEEAGKYLFGKKFKTQGLVINNGVDFNKFSEVDKEICQSLIERYDLSGSIVIGYIARFESVKNHKFVLDIAKTMKNQGIKFKVLLVGGGGLRKTIESEVQENKLNSNVELLGVRADIPNLLKVFDVFLMPSLYEGNPVVLVEAQASGLPCVISDVITDKIDIGLGLIKRCSLDSDINDWIHCIVDSVNNRLFDSKKIDEALNDRGYNLFVNAQLLFDIYTKQR